MSIQNVGPNMEDWKDLKFGMFIHWGLYALLGRGEWVMYNEAIDPETYAKLAEDFTAEKFDARKWAKIAKEAGMKYMVLTTRHHDGFSLWDSKGSVGNFTSMNSAARKDFVREYAEACRAEGLKVGFYYSPLDWRFPGFWFPKMYRQSAMELRQQTHDQLKELMTEYGKVDILWFDGGEDGWLGFGRDLNKTNMPRVEGEPINAGFWGADELYPKLREWQPGIVISNRFGMREFGDFSTPEQRIGNFDNTFPWESCMTIINGVWGWVPDKKPLSLRELLNWLIQAVTGDGNMILNVGPRPSGEIEPCQAERLLEMGEWLAEYGESIYGTRGGPFKNNENGGMTCKDNVIYVHVWNWKDNVVTLQKIDAEIKSVTSLTAQEFSYELEDGVIRFTVGKQDRKDYDTIVKIELGSPAKDLMADKFWCE